MVFTIYFMITKFSDFLKSINERYLNLIDNKELKNKYKQEVYDMLQSTYSKIGGLKGNGYGSPDELVSIPFWKIVIRDGKVKAVSLYKDKDGRKLAVLANDGTKDGKYELIKMFIEDLKFQRAWMEVSDSLVYIIKKHLPNTYIELAVPYEEVEQKLGKVGDTISKPPTTDIMMKEFPELKHYFYQRKIGNEVKTKIIFGNINSQKIII
jgi:hypothetical protein